LWSSLAATMNRERAQLGRSIMRKLITTIALLALMDTSVAIAQTVGLQKSIRTTFIDEPGQAIAAGGAGRPPPTAGRSSALGEKPDG
jgi:hypothetical protein